MTLKGLFILDSDANDKIYGEDEKKEIGSVVDIYHSPLTKSTIKTNPSLLRDADVIFSGWGCPVLDKDFLKEVPKLKVVFYGAGSIKGIVTDEFWDRDIRITSSYAANAIPVAEYTLAQILLCLKRVWYYVQLVKNQGDFNSHDFVPGVYGSTVGIISLGRIGCHVCELLKAFDLKVIAYDPFVSQELAAKMNVELCSLEELFRRSDVVSLHTPWLKETENMITGRHFASMKPYAAFINTARGAIVRETEMIEILKERSDIQAILDVTFPEPPVKGSALYTLSNVVLTPHIAGSMFNECRRMGRYMLDELKRYIAGEPLQWEITREKEKILA